MLPRLATWLAWWNSEWRSMHWLGECLQLQLQREALSPEEAQSMQEHLGYHSDSLLSVHVTGKKPNFEVGSSSQLKLLHKKSSSGKTSGGHSSVCGEGLCGWVDLNILRLVLQCHLQTAGCFLCFYLGHTSIQTWNNSMIFPSVACLRPPQLGDLSHLFSWRSLFRPWADGFVLRRPHNGDNTFIHNSHTEKRFLSWPFHIHHCTLLLVAPLLHPL